MFLLIGHLNGSDGADEAVALLSAQPDTRRLRWARSTEAPDSWVLVAEFDSAAAYRRALSPFDVRTVVVPWLSRAEVREAGVFEVHAAADGGALTHPEITVPDPGR